MEISLEEWLKRIGNKMVPVLAHTNKELQYQCARENAPIAELVDIVERDPGLAVYLLRVMNGKSGGSLRTDVTSVQQALMMMGTDMLSELPNRLPSLEKALKEPAITRLLKTFSRAYHAARQSIAWASIRRDMTPDEVFAATQLHFLGEMYIAMLEPQLLDRIDAMSEEKRIASEEAQYVVLGFTLDQLTAKLARQWKLPELVLEALHPENAKFPRAYGIMLAVQLARAASVNWYSDKTLQVQQHAAEWLDLPLDEIIARSHSKAADIARDSLLYKVRPAATGLPLIHHPEEETDQAGADQIENADICLMPQLAVLRELLGQLQSNKLPAANAYQLVSNILKGLHDGVGLNRVLYASYDHDSKLLSPQKIIGADSDPVFSRFQISLVPPNLFSRLMEKQQAILINDQSRAKFWSLVPADIQKLIGTNSFIAMSVVIDNKPIGLFYADRHSSACQIDQKTYNFFKTICSQASKLMAGLPRLDFSQ